MAWPTRSYVCIDCRTLLPEAACAASGRHRVTSLATADTRELLLEEVWGPTSMRQRLLEAGTVGAGTAASSTGFRACDVLGVFGLDGFLLVFLVFALLWFLGSWIVALVRRRRVRRSGRGARAPGLQAGRMRGVPGTVMATRTELDPITGHPCVGYAAELRDTRGVMLRDSATVGFDIELVTGERVRVPAGPVVVDMARAPSVTANLDAYREQIDPLHAGTQDLEALPGDDLRLQLIRPGDTVEVIAEVEPMPVGEAGYRDPAQSVVVARSPVRLRTR